MKIIAGEQGGCIMKINLTKKQYQLLMEKCYIADWVIHAYRRPEDGIGEDYLELQQYLLGFAKDFGYEDNVSHIRENDRYVWAEDYLEKNPDAGEYILHYDFNRYADILSDRLADMAIKERYSPEELEAKDPQELSKEFYELKLEALKTTSLLHGNQGEKEE